MESGSSAGAEFLAELPLPNPLKLNPFFFSWGTGSPVNVLAISRMIREMEESSRTKGVPVFCICRTAAKSLGIFHEGGTVRALVICSSLTPEPRGSYRLTITSSLGPPELKNWLMRRLELRSSGMAAWVTR